MITFNRIWSNTLLTSSNSCFENILNTRCFFISVNSPKTNSSHNANFVRRYCTGGDACYRHENLRHLQFTILRKFSLSAFYTHMTCMVKWFQDFRVIKTCSSNVGVHLIYVSGVYLLHSNPHISTVMVVELWWVGYDRVGCWTGMCRWYMQWVCACNLCWNRQQKQPLISSEIDLLGIQLTATLTLWLLENVTLILKVWLSNP